MSNAPSSDPNLPHSHHPTPSSRHPSEVSPWANDGHVNFFISMTKLILVMSSATQRIGLVICSTG